ncbi:hypothetical protein [Chachezhania sediminis]|uniref:hypothetical protein n=1 Tax=Chachezhania sediminis TaxID=2599291 RepID=UPI00131BCE6B|nr:hypothetical protein [Chachezhania sediminis]
MTDEKHYPRAYAHPAARTGPAGNLNAAPHRASGGPAVALVTDMCQNRKLRFSGDQFEFADYEDEDGDFGCDDGPVRRTGSRRHPHAPPLGTWEDKI